MSYEGFTQFLCKNGHYWEVDALDPCGINDPDYTPQDQNQCDEEVCKSSPIWRNQVDTTNEDYDHPDSGYVVLDRDLNNTVQVVYKIPAANLGTHLK
jgi:hypothetical protein